MTTQIKYVLDLPFSEKHLAKEHKCLWDPDSKKWFSYDSKNSLLEQYRLVTLENFDFDHKDFIKCNGGKYNPINKSWYTFKSNEILLEFMTKPKRPPTSPKPKVENEGWKQANRSEGDYDDFPTRCSGRI